MSLKGRSEYIPTPGQAIESGRNPEQLMTSGEEGRKALFGVGSSYFVEGLCIDVLYDRSDTVDGDEKTYLGEINDKCSGEDINLTTLRLAPRNSIIVRDDFGVHVAFPFFPSQVTDRHLSLLPLQLLCSNALVKGDLLGRFELLV